MSTVQNEATRVCEARDCDVTFVPQKGKPDQRFHTPLCRMREHRHTKRGGLPRARPAPKTVAQLLEEQISNEEMLAQEVKQLRAAGRQTRDRDVLDERLLALVENAIKGTRPIYKPGPSPVRTGFTPHRFVLQWSDIHASEIVDPIAIGGLNNFNWDVMLRRHDKLRDSILSFREHRPYAVEGLHILALGDMVTGDIHDELKMTNEKVLTEATVQLAKEMAAWIESFVPEFPWIKIDAVFGNHGRRSKKPQFKQAYDNWDWLFYKIMEGTLSKYPSISFNASKAATLPVQVYDRTVLLWHGDGVPSNMPGVPWGGILRRTKELSDTHASLGQRISHYAVGHYHEPNIVSGTRVLMNGSIKGPDEYSLARFGGGAPAAQNLFTFHPVRGLTDWSRIDLSDVQ